MGFLAGIAKAAGSMFLSKIVGKATDKATDKIMGEDNSPVLTAKQNAQNQANLDANNPNDIRRHNQFLMGTATAEGQAYAQRQWETRDSDRRQAIYDMEQLTPVRAQTDKDYMDTVYAGTSPWERLGSGASPSLSAPAPDKGPSSTAAQSSQYLASLTPLAIAEAQNKTQKDIANIQASNQFDIAKLNQETELQKLSVQTQDGAIPFAQLATERAKRLLTLAQEDQAHAGASFQRNREVLDTVAALLAVLPQEKIDLEIYQRSENPGWRELAKLIGTKEGSQFTEEEVKEALQGMSAANRNSITNDTLEIAGGILKAGKAVGGLANSAGGFLGKLSKGNKAKKQGIRDPHGKKAKEAYFYY